MRNDEPAAAIKLSHAEIVAIREQVDEEMPLQYVAPVILDQHEHARMLADGTFGTARDLAPDDDPHGGAEVPGDQHDAAHPATDAAGAGAAGTGAAGTGAAPATGATAATPTQDTDGAAAAARRAIRVAA